MCTCDVSLQSSEKRAARARAGRLNRLSVRTLGKRYMPVGVCGAARLIARGLGCTAAVPNGDVRGLRTSPRAESGHVGSRDAVSARRRRRALACPRTVQPAADSLDALARAHGPGERGRAILCNSLSVLHSTV